MITQNNVYALLWGAKGRLRDLKFHKSHLQLHTHTHIHTGPWWKRDFCHLESPGTLVAAGSPPPILSPSAFSSLTKGRQTHLLRLWQISLSVKTSSANKGTVRSTRV